MSDKFSIDNLRDAVDDLATIPFFPKESRASVQREMAKMCPSYKALRFVVDTAQARCTQWPGMAELRGLLCSRFDAADGIDQPHCSIQGFTAEEAEARFLEGIKPQRKLSAESKEMIRQLGAGLKAIGGK
jgi:hypothetical protein